MLRNIIEEEIAICAKERMKKHVANYTKYDDARELLQWRTPGTGIYAITYIRNKNYLYVSGDLYEAVYKWSQDVTLLGISNCGLSYFVSKCRASQYGISPTVWNEHVALSTIIDNIRSDYDISRRRKTLRAFREYNGPHSLYSREDWFAWLDTFGDDVFDADYWEYYSKVGEVTSIDAIYHLIGLQMAMKQLEQANG